MVHVPSYIKRDVSKRVHVALCCSLVRGIHKFRCCPSNGPWVMCGSMQVFKATGCFSKNGGKTKVNETRFIVPVDEDVVLHLFQWQSRKWTFAGNLH
ncbi:hypothetical protein HYDPIDRAFT_116289 [Hydnomerulius pinastri MD-312]|uniref:Uncharacterized protein n=1 Tax=Hydnomerulius pinastri MD-312 TaxID=994086 RepID=A0A0C9W4D0_9AGAM|nr:hypothetical protein HYDPIDRAFT_116289 [Hydnomerulius pinastri MD-312]